MTPSCVAQLAGPLLHERDAYLAWALRRSKAVNGARCVVGVVGYGHLRGVVYHLQADAARLRFRDLVGLTGGGDGRGVWGGDAGGSWGGALLTGLGILSGIWWAASYLPHAL